jgi:hypothetical protein
MSKEGGLNMKRVLFLLTILALVSILSSCAELLTAYVNMLSGELVDFHNRSSYSVTVSVDAGTRKDGTFTLKPGQDYNGFRVDYGPAHYTYTPSDLVETGGKDNKAYYFWNKGKPRPY